MKPAEAMAKLPTCSMPKDYYTACSLDVEGRKCHFFLCAFTLSICTIIAVLSPVAVAGNALILAAIWKKTFVRTPFHILLSGLALTDLCTGLIAQPFVAANTFLYSANPGIAREKPVLVMALRVIGEASATYSVAITILLITLMSIERWLHMSRRSLVTSRRGRFTVVLLLLLPVPLVVFRFLDTTNGNYGHGWTTTIIMLMLSCYLTTAFAYFKVYRIIRHHQQQVQSHVTSQNFGRQAIDLAKYKRSVASMLYILLLFSLCFLPLIVSAGVALVVGFKPELYAVNMLTLLLLFLSSSLNPGLYVWRMKNIRNGVKELFCRDS